MRWGKLEVETIHVHRTRRREIGLGSFFRTIAMRRDGERSCFGTFGGGVPVEMDGFHQRCILQVLLTIYLWVLPLTSATCLLWSPKQED